MAVAASSQTLPDLLTSENKSLFSQDEPRPREEKPRSWFLSGPALVLYVASTKLLIQLAVAGRYGYFVDELYFLACGQHLDWGYVDHPPFVAWLAQLARATSGDSLYSLRLLPALAGSAVVWLTGALTRELGGGRYA